MQERIPYVELESQYQRYLEIGQSRRLSKEEKAAMRANRKLNRIFTFGLADSKVSKHEISDLITTATREFDDDKTVSSLFDIDTRKNCLSGIPDLKELLQDRFGVNEKAERVQKISVCFAQQAIDPNSLKDLETFGIGGLVREPTIELPKQLWKGRYLMMRIPNLLEADDMGMDAYRPCALWRAFAKADENGDPILAGLELHPCTRGQAHAFQYKMRVTPMDTVVSMPSFLIADMQIRAPISAEYFHPIQPTDGKFYELLPNMVEAFDAKRQMVQEREGRILTYGLQSVPEDWIEVALPEPPNERLREYLGRNRLRFVNGQRMAAPERN